MHSMHPFDGTPDSLIVAAEPAGIHLNDENVLDYARFYLDHIWTEDDGFKLVRSFTDIEFTGDISTFKLMQLKAKLFTPKVESAGKKETENGAEGLFRLTAPVLYADNLYRAVMEVKHSGELSIIEEKHLLKDVPTRVIFLE